MAERSLRIPETRLTKDKLREDYGNEPGTVSPFADGVRDALVSVGAGAGEDLPAGFQRPLPDRNGAVPGKLPGSRQAGAEKTVDEDRHSGVRSPVSGR